MTNKQEMGITLYGDRYLAVLRGNPNLGLEFATGLNEGVHNSLQIEKFLEDLNERLFFGKGEVRPLRHLHTLTPSEQIEPQSRFSMLFSLKASLSSAISAAELWVKRGELNLKGRSFYTLAIGVYQALDIENESYDISLEGSLYYTYHHRNGDTGDWDGKPGRLSRVSNGRMLTFSLNSVPGIEDISETLFEQAGEVLKEMAIQDLIPEVKKAEDSSIDTNG